MYLHVTAESKLYSSWKSSTGMLAGMDMYHVYCTFAFNMFQHGHDRWLCCYQADSVIPVTCNSMRHGCVWDSSLCIVNVSVTTVLGSTYPITKCNSITKITAGWTWYNRKLKVLEGGGRGGSFSCNFMYRYLLIYSFLAVALPIYISSWINSI